jgi:hypothetical protein
LLRLLSELSPALLSHFFQQSHHRTLFTDSIFQMKDGEVISAALPLHEHSVPQEM